MPLGGGGGGRLAPVADDDERSQVRTEVSDGVGTLTLNDPQRRNALNAAMVDEIVAAMDRFEADPAVGAVVVTGAPPAFCAGANLGNLAEPPTGAACARSTRASCGSPAARCPRWPR